MLVVFRRRGFRYKAVKMKTLPVTDNTISETEAMDSKMISSELLGGRDIDGEVVIFVQ